MRADPQARARRERRERVLRRAKARADEAAAAGTILTLERHDRSYRMEYSPGKIAACVAAGRPYEAPLLEHIYRQRFTGLAVDAGANIGNHTLWFAVMCGLRVAAFEPIHADVLRRNVALNGLEDRVQVEPVALGDTDGAATHIGKGRLEVGAGPIPIRRLDDYHLSDVALIKADVEGMEAFVLRGGVETIRRDRPVVYAEAWDDTYHQGIADVLEPLGYARTKRFHGKDSATPVEGWVYGS